MTPKAIIAGASAPVAAARPQIRRGMQRGASMGGVMVMLVLIVFFVTLAIRMVPSYISFAQIRSIMDALPQKPAVVTGGPRVIMNTLSAQLGIEGIRSIDTSDFELAKTGDGLELQLAYEVRQPIVGNVDVVMRFAHTTLFPRAER